MFEHALYDSVIFFVFLGLIFFLVTASFRELIMKLSRAALRPLLAAHERGALPLVEVGCHCEKCEPPTLAAHARGALPLVGAACGVTARKASHKAHNATNARGLAAGKMGRNSSILNAT